jgi:hypothetical protein
MSQFLAGSGKKRIIQAKPRDILADPDCLRGAVDRGIQGPVDYHLAGSQSVSANAIV